MKTCVDFIMENNCPDPLICGMNCASDTNIDTNVMKIIPFNNYGTSYLRIRTCLYKIHEQRLERYATIVQGACSSLTEFEVCNRFIPPMTFVPVALPINTTYIEIDNCVVTSGLDSYNQIYSCDSTNPARVYGNQYLFPRSYDVPQTSESVCEVDGMYYSVYVVYMYIVCIYSVYIVYFYSMCIYYVCIYVLFVYIAVYEAICIYVPYIV